MKTVNLNEKDLLEIDGGILPLVAWAIIAAAPIVAGAVVYVSKK